MEIEAYTSAMVAGVPLLFVILGLVAWAKSFGLTGNWLRVVSMAIGLILGSGYLLTKGFPVEYAGWFAVVVYGLGLGIVASGIYDAGKAIVKQ